MRMYTKIHLLAPFYNYCGRRKSMFQQNKTTKSRQINVSNVFTEKQPIDNIL